MPRKTKTAFTLVELLIVIGIIVALIGILIPAVLKMYKTGKITKVKGDLAAISTALEAYKTDFGDYPRPGDNNCGFAVLAHALIGPGGTPAYTADTDGSPMVAERIPPAYSNTKEYKAGDIVSVGTPTKGNPNTWIYVCVAASSKGNNPASSDAWELYWPFDGEDGPGFRNRASVGGVKQGKVWGPYLSMDRVKTRDLAIIDSEGNAIAYFAASTPKPNKAKPFSYVAEPGTYSGVKTIPLYSVDQNLTLFRQIKPDGTLETDDTKSQPAIQAMLGDENCDGDADTAEADTVELPYLLWTAGPDGQFGPARSTYTGNNPPKRQVQACDDIVNFR